MPGDTEPTDAISATSYDEVTDDAYGQRAAASFAAIPIRGGMVLSGPCPRCTDPMTFPYVNEVYRAIRPSRRTKDPGTPKLPMICTCEEKHLGRPSGVKGCGAYWNITVTAR
ncbi:MAG: hypothetical protein ACRDTA_22325 [Pseudonocardiaceae bacterium]